MQHYVGPADVSDLIFARSGIACVAPDDGSTVRTYGTRQLHGHPASPTCLIRVVCRANVAGLFAAVVAAFPDSHITIDDIFGQANEVVVRVVVSGTQEGPIIGIPASGRFVQWDGVDVYI